MFGKYLREARLRRGWSQRVLAVKLNVSQPFVCMMENARAIPTSEIQHRILVLMPELDSHTIITSLASDARSRKGGGHFKAATLFLTLLQALATCLQGGGPYG